MAGLQRKGGREKEVEIVDDFETEKKIKLTKEVIEVWVIKCLWSLEEREDDLTLNVVNWIKEGRKIVWNGNINWNEKETEQCECVT